MFLLNASTGSILRRVRKKHFNLLVDNISKYNKAPPLLDSVKIISIRTLHLGLSSNEFRATQVN